MELLQHRARRAIIKGIYTARPHTATSVRRVSSLIAHVQLRRTMNNFSHGPLFGPAVSRLGFVSYRSNSSVPSPPPNPNPPQKPHTESDKPENEPERNNNSAAPQPFNPPAATFNGPGGLSFPRITKSPTIDAALTTVIGLCMGNLSFFYLHL